MTNLKLIPKTLSGTVTVPPSKSMAHRAVICASLAEGRSVIHNIQLSEDIQATIEGMQAFGAVILHEENTLTIDGIGSASARRSHTIDCNESGSTLRFLVPVATLFAGETRFTGRGKLGQRPMHPYQEIFAQQSVSYEPADSKQLNLTIEGKLKPGTYNMRGDISSQFITGMLLTLPLLEGDSVLNITTHLESKGYIDLTLSVLETFGISIINENDTTFKIAGNQSYQSQQYTVEGDYSQAAFWLTAEQLGNPVIVDGLKADSLQGDQEIIQILKQLQEPKQHERVIDGAQVPDIIPIAALAAALSEGKTSFTNLERLKIKESDRLMATQKELAALGAQIIAEGNTLHITGQPSLKGGQEVWSHKDHRMAMMLAVASTVCREPIYIKDTECVQKSYPDFWEVFQKAGGEVHEWNMG
ncbi:3-phosphoshikimate 1-carboxyvinyltransferase [Marinilactibacillus piezotolerans]|uniref:3-phosphoshikimate 1-carboxyvinyltransferase n=1 Tax=Marinilactibacillus piezotolerans TaxID=258723 RepID=UPI0009AF2806|nr:3-phosphoshikimate 1-carboxyvinyltransferase [Marinilactibacillus piezotolerans]